MASKYKRNVTASDVSMLDNQSMGNPVTVLMWVILLSTVGCLAAVGLTHWDLDRRRIPEEVDTGKLPEEIINTRRMLDELSVRAGGKPFDWDDYGNDGNVVVRAYPNDGSGKP